MKQKNMFCMTLPPISNDSYDSQSRRGKISYTFIIEVLYLVVKIISKMKFMTSDYSLIVTIYGWKIGIRFLLNWNKSHRIECRRCGVTNLLRQKVKHKKLTFVEYEKQRTHYDKAFKENAVKLSLDRKNVPISHTN